MRITTLALVYPAKFGSMLPEIYGGDSGDFGEPDIWEAQLNIYTKNPPCQFQRLVTEIFEKNGGFSVSIASNPLIVRSFCLPGHTRLTHPGRPE